MGKAEKDDMNERERRIAEDVLLAFSIEHAESDEDRAGWERERATPHVPRKHEAAGARLPD